MTIKIHVQTNKMESKRGVRQGDVISPKLFTLVLEDVFKKVNWSEKEINIHGEYPSILRFTDDIVLFGRDNKSLLRC